MAAKDGSFSFDFEGVYEKVIPHQLIEYGMSDGRKVKVVFEQKGDAVHVLESFDAENINPVEMQQAGWQAILNNFKKHAEGNEGLIVIHFSVLIQAPVEKVFSIMLEKETYQQWTAEFNPTSTYEGSWQKGAKMLFVGTNKNGEKEGMVSRIREHVLNQFISIEHLGFVRGNEELTTGKEVEGWAGSLENYTFTNENGKTNLEVDLDSNEEFKSYFEEAWPRALQKLKTLCEL
jgi:uncharacterized protein YndB with AHSA1/START domain